MKNLYISFLILIAVIVVGFVLLRNSKLEEASPLPQVKIDVNVACESALAYTTFLNSEDADKFILECVNGEHPDVIERYIESLGVDGAAI